MANRKRQIWIWMMAAMTMLMTPSCSNDQEPSAPEPMTCPTKVVINIPSDLMPAYQKRAEGQTRAEGEGLQLTLRAVIEIYNQGSTQLISHCNIVLIPTAVTNVYYFELDDLNEGDYDIYVWADFSADGSDLFYNTESLQAVQIISKPFDSDQRRAYMGKTTISVDNDVLTHQSPIKMKSPFAHYRIEAIDVAQYEQMKHANGWPELEDLFSHYLHFFAPEGVKPEFVFAGGRTFRPVPGFKSTFTYKGIKVTTLTRQQALNALKVNGKLLIADATVLPREDGADLLCLGRNTVNYVVYPSKQGFKEQTVSVESVTPQFEVKKAGPRRMSVNGQWIMDNGQLPQVQEYFLRVNYVGDVAMAFMKGQLVQDEFYHGEPWTIGLKRYYNDLKTDLLTFYFRPLQKNAPFLRDLPKQAVPDFSDGSVVEIRDVEVVPEYRLRVTF